MDKNARFFFNLLRTQFLGDLQLIPSAEIRRRVRLWHRLLGDEDTPSSVRDDINTLLKAAEVELTIRGEK